MYNTAAAEKAAAEEIERHRARGAAQEEFMQNVIKRITCQVLSLLCALMLLPANVFAAEAIDTGKDVTLTIEYRHEGKGIPDAEFLIYQAGTVDAYGKITLIAPFASYPVSTEGLTKEGWNALALTLAGYVQRDKLPALDSGKTSADGKLKFPSSSSVVMKPGLYLVIGKSCTVDHYVYAASPFMAFLPGDDAANNTWKYDMTVTAKYERQEEKISRKVLKIWDDKGYEDKRAKEISVQLLRDGQVYETVTLTKDNGWRYTWNDLPARYTWTIAEKELTGYTVKVGQEGITYTIKNTYIPPKTPPEEPGKPPRIPTTGQLWWPVPLFGIAGLIFLLTGILRRKRER